MPTKPTIESLLDSPTPTRLSTSPAGESSRHLDSATEEAGSPHSSASGSQAGDRNSSKFYHCYPQSESPRPSQSPLISDEHRTSRGESTADEHRSYRSYSPAESTSSSRRTISSSVHPHLPFLRVAPSHPRSYELIVVQQPYTAAEFGKNDMSRIPLAPPLFVRLIVRGNTGDLIDAPEEYPFFVAAITLHQASSSNLEDLSFNSALYGTTTAAPQNLKDAHGDPGVFFVFPDVGVRLQGTWRLHVSLMRIASVGSQSILEDGAAGSRLTGVLTEPFDVVPVEGYIAPKVTTLTRHFQSQGVRMFTSNSVVTH